MEVSQAEDHQPYVISGHFLDGIFGHRIFPFLTEWEEGRVVERLQTSDGLKHGAGRTVVRPDGRRIYQVVSEWDLIKSGAERVVGAEGAGCSVSPSQPEVTVPFEGVFKRAA